MKSIGFRCWKDKFAFVVVEASQDRPIIVAYQRRERPPHTSRAEFLVWVRENVREILDTYEPEAAAFKAAEVIAKKKDLQRAEVEGVLQEAVQAHDLQLEARLKRKQQIKAELDGFEDRAKYVDRALETRGLGHLGSDYREAALAALCHLAVEGDD